MPVVISNPLYPQQYGSFPQLYQPATTQLNLRGMIGEVLMWNPDIDPMLVKRLINNNYRKVIERRNWYGLLTRGQISTPQFTSSGQATVTNGWNQVQGTGTQWYPNLIGQQFRIGFTNPFQTIVNVDPAAQTLTLDMPYGAQSITTSGYQIVQAWVTLGANIRYILDAVNQQQGWRMEVNVPQQTVNETDTWRTNVGWSYAFVNREPTPDGQLQIEIYPVPFFLQVFPFLAYTQPADLQNDGDSPVLFIRSDVLVMMSIADALVWRGKNNKYYDPQTAGLKMQQAEQELVKMERTDDSMYTQDTIWDFGHEWGYVIGQGSLFGQNHAMGSWGAL
jgi:hypothetical protein